MLPRELLNSRNPIQGQSDGVPYATHQSEVHELDCSRSDGRDNRPRCRAAPASHVAGRLDQPVIEATLEEPDAGVGLVRVCGGPRPAIGPDGPIPEFIEENYPRQRPARNLPSARQILGRGYVRVF